MFSAKFTPSTLMHIAWSLSSFLTSGEALDSLAINDSDNYMKELLDELRKTLEIHKQHKYNNRDHMAVGRILTCGVLPFISAIGISLNLVSVCVFSGVGRHSHRNRSAVQVFLCALCIFDLIQLCLSAIILPAQFIGSSYEPNSSLPICAARKIFVSVLPVCYPILMISNLASVWTIVGITVQRFRAVCYPLQNRHHNGDIRQAVYSVLCVVGLSTFFGIPSIIRFTWTDKYITDGCTEISFGVAKRYSNDMNTSAITQLVYRRINGWTLIMCLYVIPLSCIAVLNGMMLRAIYHAKRASIRPPNQRQQNEFRAVSMIATVVVVFIVCQSVKVINFMREFILMQEILTDRLSWIVNDINNMLVNVNSALNPLIYIIFTRRFRNIFWEQVSRSRITASITTRNNFDSTINNNSVCMLAKSPSMPRRLSNANHPVCGSIEAGRGSNSVLFSTSTPNSSKRSYTGPPTLRKSASMRQQLPQNRSRGIIVRLRLRMGYSRNGVCRKTQPPSV